ncbi:DsrE family protein [uncultured Paracoccus sp.]|uniref:DsrE family protein n=1 Tax=uncultured Paracoccus sp. TaxID=189685 RepID=UPI00261DDD8C|nr:DsrE family protein [uncultured Paracoccus sp.]
MNRLTLTTVALVLGLAGVPALAQTETPAAPADSAAAPAAPSATDAAGPAGTAGATGTAAAEAAPADAGKPAEMAEATDYGEQKAVYHMNYAGGIDGSGYRPALNNMQNHLDAVGDANLDLRVVMHGDGLGLLAAAKKDQGLQAIISGLKERGVDFLVCKNTLDGRNIDPEKDLFDVWPEDIVQAGVAEVARLQGEGFVYIKP